MFGKTCALNTIGTCIPNGRGRHDGKWHLSFTLFSYQLVPVLGYVVIWTLPYTSTLARVGQAGCIYQEKSPCE